MRIITVFNFYTASYKIIHFKGPSHAKRRGKAKSKRAAGEFFCGPAVCIWLVVEGPGLDLLLLWHQGKSRWKMIYNKGLSRNLG